MMQETQVPSAKTIHPTLSILPRRGPQDAFEGIQARRMDGDYTYDLSKCKITPDNISPWTPDRLRAFILLFPETQFYLDDSLRFDRMTMFDRKPSWPWYDLSRFIQDPDGGRIYFKAMSMINQMLGNPIYTLSTGERPAKSSLSTLADAVCELEDIMQCPVAVKGFYPHTQKPGRIQKKKRYWIDTWQDYQGLLESGLRVVANLGHFNIIASQKGRNDDLVKDFLSSSNMVEIRLSSNDGTADQRGSLAALSNETWWEPLLATANPNAAWFSEGMA